jgi:O-antigen ligase
LKKEAVKIKYEAIPYYLLLVLIVVLPLIFSSSVESMFSLMKSITFRIAGSLFIIASIFFLWNKLKQGKSGIIVNKMLDTAVLLILIAAIVSTIFSINPYVSIIGQYMRQIGLLTYFVLVLIYFSVSVSVVSAEKRDKVLLAMEITAGLTALYSILQYIGIDPFGLLKVAFVRPISSFGNSVFSAGYMVMVLPFAFIRVLQKKFSLFPLIILIMILTGIIISQTRSVYAALIVEIILFCFFFPYVYKSDIEKFKRVRRKTLIIFGSVIILLIAVNIFLPGNIFIKRFQSITKITDTQRWVLWFTSIKIFLEHPISGTGIANYSRAIEDFLTIALKDKEANGYFDNAHNNFIHTLATMGVIGLAAYLLMLFTAVKQSISAVMNNLNKRNRLYIIIAFICMLGGYIIYGFADFDEVTILAYLFIFLALLKIELFSNEKSKIFKLEFKNNLRLKNGLAVLSFIVISFSLYNIYNSYIDYKADKIYSVGLRNRSGGSLKDLNNKLSEAIELNPRPEYRYAYAYYNYIYCFTNPDMQQGDKRTMLQLSENQINEAVKNHPSQLDCYGLLALIKYEEGDSLEGERLKNEVLAKDTLQTSFRVNLARYYFQKGNEDKALEQLKIVYIHDPNNIDAYFTSVVYLIRKKEYTYAENCCNIILQHAPGNASAIGYLNEIRRLKSIK